MLNSLSIDGPDNVSSIDELHSDLVNGFAARLIKQKVRQLSREFKRERKDLEQEFFVHLLRKWKDFRPKRAHWNVFAKTLIERHAATLVRRRNASKRRFERTSVSIDSLGSNDNGQQTSLAESICSTRRAARVGVYHQSGSEQSELKADVATVLAGLPKDDCDLCTALMEMTPSELSRVTGIPRTTLRRRIAEFKKLLDGSRFSGQLKARRSR